MDHFDRQQVVSHLGYSCTWLQNCQLWLASHLLDYSVISTLLLRYFHESLIPNLRLFVSGEPINPTPNFLPPWVHTWSGYKGNEEKLHFLYWTYVSAHT